MIFDERIAILIGLGASVSCNCQPCVHIHVKKAKEAGISDQEIKEAIIIGRNVKKGAAAKFDDFLATVNEGSYSCSDNTGGCCPTK